MREESQYSYAKAFKGIPFVRDSTPQKILIILPLAGRTNYLT